jgi:anti-sigma B factor antagonist
LNNIIDLMSSITFSFGICLNKINFEKGIRYSANTFTLKKVDMKYTIDKQDNYATLQLQEENLNALIAPELKSEFIFLRNEGVKNLILDLNHVKYVDSSGLSAILTANRLWKGVGSLILCEIKNESVSRLIEISRLETILTILDKKSDAISFILTEEAETEA